MSSANYFSIFSTFFLNLIVIINSFEFHNNLHSNPNNNLIRHDNRFQLQRFCNPKKQPFYRRALLDNTASFVFVVILFMLLVLLLMGLIKGILGLCSRSIGEYGLFLLIDLPKPLDKYQEKNLRDIPVRYDIGGWPIHPITCDRTVQVLPTSVEFCLNVVFFLAYPLALFIQLCGFCCCIRSESNDENTEYKRVNVIKLTECPIKPKNICYGENDPREAVDTQYVINEMRRSQVSFKECEFN